MMRLACLLLLLLASTPLTAESIVFVADLNGRYGSASYHDRVGRAVGTIATLQPDLVVSTGDMVAGQKQGFDRAKLDLMWREFNRAVADPLRQAGIPLAVTPGNHDGSAFPGFELDRKQFAAQWQERVPEIEMLAGSEWPWRYAARMGRLLLVAFDGTRPGALPESERAFLERMLANYSSGADATVVFSHLPMWPFAVGREREIINDPGLLALLHRHGVDAYASGHHHVFYAGVDHASMLHLSIGALGGNARAFSGQGMRQPHSFAVVDIEAGKLVVRVHPAPAFEAETGVSGPPVIEGPLGSLQRMDKPLPLRR
jgi:DNA repair exonuclease SbcCD nuclease subunit